MCDNEADSNRRGPMTSVRTIQRGSLGVRLFTTSFLPIITLALNRPIAQAESPRGSAPSDEQSLSTPSVVTLLTRGAPATPRQAQPRSVAGIGNASRQYCPLSQYQIDDLSDLWPSLLPSKDQLTLPLTIQKKNAQSTIPLQSPALLKAVL